MPLVEIHRSTRATCEHLAFVLKAVGIGSEVVPIGDFHVLFVEPGAVAIAQRQLELYYAENARSTKPSAPVIIRELSWIAPAIYAAILLGIAYLAGRNTFGRDWYTTGALTHSVQAGEWWRAITALTLHVDHQHLLSNIGFGALFAFVAARLIGSGITLWSIVVAAILGNVADVLLMPDNHVAIGASTAVFATLGLVSAYSWRIQLSGRLRWAHRWAPLIVGVMLLGFLGSGGENTDVLAHLTGFFFGVVFGMALALVPVRHFGNAVLQISGGVLAAALLIGAWIVAFLT